MEYNQRDFGKVVGEFNGSVCDDAVRDIFDKRKELCEALRTIKRFAETMLIPYTIVKDDAGKIDSQISDFHFLNQVFLNFVKEICKYPEEPEPGNYGSIKNQDRHNFKKYLIEAGYKITKK